MRRYLIVANQTLLGNPLLGRVQEYRWFELPVSTVVARSVAA